MSYPSNIVILNLFQDLRPLGAIYPQEILKQVQHDEFSSAPDLIRGPSPESASRRNSGKDSCLPRSNGYGNRGVTVRSTNIISVIFFCMVFLATATASNAQINGSRLNKQAGPRDGEAVVWLYARCIAELDSEYSRSLLNTLPSSMDEDRVIKSRSAEDNSRCLDNKELVMDNREIRFGSMVLRGNLAAYYLKSDFRGKSAEDAFLNGATNWLESKVQDLSAGEPFERGRIVGYSLAACLVDNHWELARQYVSTKSGSKKETAALGTLSLYFGNCLVQGAKLKLNKKILRHTLAESLYHSLYHKPKAIK